jgi:hypothetical protein
MEGSMTEKPPLELDQLSRADLLDLARKVASLANTDETGHPRRSSRAAGSAGDPLVRSLATIALKDLLKEFSFRQIASIFNVSHSRVHQLAQDLDINSQEAAEERKKA